MTVEAALTPTPPAPVQASCPVCGTAIVPTLARTCERCDTPHHTDCWEYAGGCAIFGCARECASHSRESSLSSPSSSSLSSSLSPSPPVPAAFHRWLWAYRLYATTLSVVGIGASTLGATAFAGVALTGVTRYLGVLPTTELVHLLYAQFWFLWAILALLVVLAGLVMTVTMVPAHLLRNRVEADLAHGLAPPRAGVRSVLDHLVPGTISSGLLRLLGRLGPIALPFCILGLLSFSSGLSLVILTPRKPAPLGIMLFEAGLALLVGTVPLLAARDRMTWLETLQNRVAASFKSQKGGPS